MADEGAVIEAQDQTSEKLIFAKKILKIILDGLLLGLAYTFAYWIRFDFNIPSEHFEIFQKTIVIAVLINIAYNSISVTELNEE